MSIYGGPSVQLVTSFKRRLDSCSAMCRALEARRREAARVHAYERAISSRLGVL
jgi:hypothetical protein